MYGPGIPENGYIFSIKVTPTNPVLNFVTKMESGRHEMMKGGPLSLKVRKLLFINNGIFIKAEFVKTSFRIIETCYHRWASKLPDGNIRINPALFYPALREIDNLILEQGTILDLFSRELNITCDLKIPFRKIDFGNAVREITRIEAENELKKHILAFANSESYLYYKDIRNMIAHRLPFVTRGNDTKLYFPDDPNEDAIIPKMDREIDIYDTCKEWVHSFFSFLDKGTYLCFNQIARIELRNTEVEGELDYDTFCRLENEARNREAL